MLTPDRPPGIEISRGAYALGPGNADPEMESRGQGLLYLEATRLRWSLVTYPPTMVQFKGIDSRMRCCDCGCGAAARDHILWGENRCPPGW